MKWSWSVWMMLCLVPVSVSAADLGLGRIGSIQGNVQIKTEGAADWQLATVNVPVRESDRYWCPEGARAELQFSDGTVLRLDHNSSLDVLRLSDTVLQVHLGMGELYFHSGGLQGRTAQVDLPETSVVVHGSTKFDIRIAPEGAEEISIFRGTAEVASSGAQTKVRTGEMLTLAENSSEVSPLDAPDEWENYNVARDREQATAEDSARYLPPELSAYANDLDENGEWVDVADYGYCWRPRVVVTAGWAPYRLGHWVWIGSDYCWVAFESWGWAPYHYGRWLWRREGWCWVPPSHRAVYWGPGYVGWVHTGDHVGWVPLGPGETYYGHGHFGPHSVNLAVGVQGPAHAEFRYMGMPHAVTVVDRDGFLSGRPVRALPADRFMIKGHFQFGTPDLKPQAASMRFGAAPSGAQLPKHEVRTVDLGALRQQHPLMQVPVSVSRPVNPAGRPGAPAAFNRTNPVAGAAQNRVPPAGNFTVRNGAPQSFTSTSPQAPRPTQRIWRISPRVPGNSGRSVGASQPRPAVQPMQRGSNGQGEQPHGDRGGEHGGHFGR